MPQTPGLSTLAKRNPTKPVQAPRKRRNDSAATKATKALESAERAGRMNALYADVDQFYEEKAEREDSLALKHHQKKSYIRKLLNNSAYKKKRGVNLYNAIIHDLSIKAREGERWTSVASR